jgi:tetratricopeptide (TPR) repeat protein
VYLSAGKDDYAFSAFFNCRAYSDKLNYLNPDRALCYCGLGEVLYNAEEYELGTRCFLKAREIREKLLGMESVDTATVFNNLGCCFFMIDRNKEALSYFKIAATVLIGELGEFH